MGNLYLITGPAGVGKSTVSKLLAEEKEKSALIEGDDIYHLVKGGYISPWKEGNHLEVFWKNSINIINNFLQSGYDVVFNYIIMKDDLKKLKDAFPETKIKFVLLIADSDILIKRDQERAENCRMGERVLVLLNDLLNEGFKEKYILNTSNLSTDETVKEINENDSYYLEVKK